MAFSFTWNATFEAQPADNEALSLGAGRIRDLKSAISERLEIDHNHNGGADDGQHKQITFGAPLGADPTNAANLGFLYTKDVSAKVELHWIDEDGNVVPLTSAGKLLATLLDVNALTEESGITTSDFLLFYDATAGAIRKVDYNDLVVLPRGSIDGLILSNNSTDAIDVAAGQCRNGADTANMELSAALTNKQLSAVWVVGSAAGMLDTGSEAADTWYHIWLIRRSDTGVVDVLASLSATSPSMPTNYDQKRRIGAVLTDATPDILAFNQIGDHFDFEAAIRSINDTSNHTTAATGTLDVPTGLVLQAKVRAGARTGSAANGVLLTALEQVDVAPNTQAAPGVTTHGGDAGLGAWSETVIIKTNTSGQIRYRSTISTIDTLVMTLGWIDPRGRNG